MSTVHRIICLLVLFAMYSTATGRALQGQEAAQVLEAATLKSTGKADLLTNFEVCHVCTAHVLHHMKESAAMQHC